VIAGRLANLDPKLKVLLIEAGENNINNPWVYRPAIFPRNMKLDSKTATFYQANRTLNHTSLQATLLTMNSE
jgi:alcohol oxidase